MHVTIFCGPTHSRLPLAQGLKVALVAKSTFELLSIAVAGVAIVPRHLLFVLLPLDSTLSLSVQQYP